MMGSTEPLPPHLLSDREIHVIISVLSGNHTAQGYYDNTLKPFLDSHELQYSTHVTKSTQTIIELTKDLFCFNACKGVKQTIILLSGDGGLIDIVNTIATTLQRSNNDSRAPSIFFKPVIALIPHGTANAMAWSCGIATDPLATLMKGRAASVPMFEVTFSPAARLVTHEGADREVIQNTSDAGSPKIYGAVVFSWGLHASLVAKSDTAAYREHGLDRFKMAAEKLLHENHAYRGIVKVLTERGSWTRLHDGPDPANHAYILAAFVSNLEEKFQISPASRALDGKLRIIGIPHLPAEEISKLMFLPYQEGKHIEDSNVTYHEIEGLQIDLLEEHAQWRQVCIDGKIVEVEQGGWVEVKRLPGYGSDGRRVVELIR